MIRHLRVIPLLVQMYVRSKMEYRGAFWLDRFAQILSYASVFASLGILLNRFNSLGGWNWPELALLFSFQLMGYSFGASLSFVQLRNLEELVRLGTFDTLLVKPFSPWAYLIFSGLNIGYAGHLILATALMGWALASVEIAWTFGAVLYLLASMISTTMVVAALITMIGATALIWVRSNHLFALFFGFWELTRYPLNIFPAGLQVVMITAIPLAFTSSIPVAALLGKPIPLLGDWGGPVALLAGPAWVLIAMAHWRYVTGRYQGAGG